MFFLWLNTVRNCLNNAPVESFFYLHRTELLSRPLCRDLDELKLLSLAYVDKFNIQELPNLFQNKRHDPGGISESCLSSLNI